MPHPRLRPYIFLSREAQAEKAALLEELKELQSDLADEQADRTLEAQEDALDKMEESYHEEKDKEIEILEDSISSYQKLYDMAISYIETHWDTLYNELISWNTHYQYGDGVVQIEYHPRTAHQYVLVAAPFRAS